MFCTGQWMCRPRYDGGEADDAAATDGGRPAVAGAGGELHGNTQTQRYSHISYCFKTSPLVTHLQTGQPFYGSS